MWCVAGVYLIGIGYPMVQDQYSPPGYNDFSDIHPYLDELCDVFLYRLQIITHPNHVWQDYRNDCDLTYVL